MELGPGDRLSTADLELLLDALAHHRRAGTAAAQLRLVGRVQRALLEQRGAERVLAEEVSRLPAARHWSRPPATHPGE